MRYASTISFIIGTDAEMSSGWASRWALYPSYILCRNVGPWGSKHTAICVGFSFLRISSRVLQKPNMAEVLNPLEEIRGARMSA